VKSFTGYVRADVAEKVRRDEKGGLEPSLFTAVPAKGPGAVTAVQVEPIAVTAVM
jgi:hypothetical protein